MSDKPSMLMVLSRFPFPLEKGDKLRAFHHLKELSTHYSVHLHCLTDHLVTPENRKEVEQYCSSLQIHFLPRWKSLLNCLKGLVSSRPFQVHYFYSPFIQKKIKHSLAQVQPAQIFCQLIRASEYVKHHHDCEKSLDYMDTFSAGIERRKPLVSFYKRWIFSLESKRLKEYEGKIFDYFEHRFIISDQDKNLILHPEKKTIHLLPNGISPIFLQERTPQEAKFNLVFVGNLSYPPNVEAVLFLLKDIFPILRNKRKDIKVLIAGANPTREVKKAISATKGSTLWEGVKDIRDAYLAGEVFIAPMTIGTGLQNKLLEAMALGLPCVTTPLANNALQAKHIDQILIGRSPAQLAEAVLICLNSPDTFRMAKSGQKFVRENYDWQQSVNNLVEILKEGGSK
jgi:sugar transferase (PEP-CTERM/EpsH1 system associated)